MGIDVAGLAELGIICESHRPFDRMILKVYAVTGFAGDPAVGVGALVRFKGGGVAFQTGTIYKTTFAPTGKLQGTRHVQQCLRVARIIPLLSFYVMALGTLFRSFISLLGWRRLNSRRKC